jgi:hypothetical protein
LEEQYYRWGKDGKLQHKGWDGVWYDYQYDRYPLEQPPYEPHDTPTYGVWEMEPPVVGHYWTDNTLTAALTRSTVNARTKWGWLMFLLSGRVNLACASMRREVKDEKDTDVMGGVSLGEACSVSYVG